MFKIMFLFKVQERFMITGIGLVLLPGIGNNNVYVDDKIKIVRPDNSVIEATIKGISFNQNRDISVGNDLTKNDIPIGSEVWLDE